MTEPRDFEARLGEALLDYASGADREVDAWTVASRATAAPAGRFAGLTTFGRGRTGFGLAPILLLLLLLALLASAAFIGARLLEQRRLGVGSDLVVYIAPGSNGWHLFAAEPEGGVAARQLAVVTTAEASALGNRPTAHPRISADGTYVAYGRGVYPCDQLAIVELATGSWSEMGVLSPGGWPSYAWSPVGHQLALTSCPRPSSGRAVVVADVATGDIHQVLQLTDSQATVPVLVWAPDGTRLLVLDPRMAAPGTLIDLNRGEFATYTIEGQGPLRAAAWSPAGSQILLGGASTLGLARSDGSGWRLLSATAGSMGTWSPDGEWITYFGTTDDHEGATPVMVIRHDGSRAARLATAMFAGRGGQPAPPRFTPDGARIFWTDADGTWVVGLDGHGLAQLDVPALSEMDWQSSPVDAAAP